jgi:hypothetical protein
MTMDARGYIDERLVREGVVTWEPARGTGDWTRAHEGPAWDDEPTDAEYDTGDTTGLLPHENGG